MINAEIRTIRGGLLKRMNRLKWFQANNLCHSPLDPGKKKALGSFNETVIPLII